MITPAMTKYGRGFATSGLGGWPLSSMKQRYMPEQKHDSTQADKFQKLARELEADEDEAAFEETVKKIVQAPKADVAEKPE